jgi:hypothetical protein
MTRQRLINKGEIPPGGYRFLCRDTETWITAACWDDLLTAVKKHYKANNLPIGLLLDEEIETQLCSVLPGGCTYSDDKQKRRSKVIGRSDWKKFLDATLRLGKTLVEMKKQGESLVSVEQANENAKACLRCQFNQKPEGCSSCNMQDLVALLSSMSIPDLPIKGKLKGCQLCDCSLRAKVFFPAHVLAKVSKSELDIYPDWCFVKMGAGI